ncbi:MAG: hypothetical protein NC548_12995 [Lachnospiraceae bacterium]|nr:hypothetical protein [Lachnospiraceae bacterium]MCM1230693.1 hypothetical protein [Ruminococcus flavefaciens]
MDWYTFMSSVFEHITVPIIILIGGVIIAILKPYANKITTSMTMKNEMDSLEKMTKAKSNLMEQLDSLVESAVASNMQLAEDMKLNGQKLTEDQIAELNESAKNIVMVSLPIEVLDPEGSLYKLIGGEDKLDTMIKSLMEKHVYMYKLKKSQQNNQDKKFTTVISSDGSDEEVNFVTPPEVLAQTSEYPHDENETWSMSGDPHDPEDEEEIPEDPVEEEVVVTSTMKPPARFGIG